MERIEFIESSHTYLVGGVIVPSVTQLINFIYPNKFDGVPKQTLLAKSKFGTNVHNAIECYENGLEFELSPMERVVFEQYLRVKDREKIEVVEQEKMIHYQDKYAGRLDMIANVNGIRSLVDVKTTAKIDYDSLAWQLAFYELGCGEKFQKHYVLWLPKKGMGRLVEITPKTKEEVLEVVNDYEKSQQSDYG